MVARGLRCSVCVCVAPGLSYSVKESDLRSLFEREGMTVHDVIVPRSPEGTPRAGAGKGTAMVQLGSPAEAERGEAMHGKEVLGTWSMDSCSIQKPIEVCGLCWLWTP